MGPFLVPKKGVNVPLNQSNLDIYNTVFELDESNQVDSSKNGNPFIDDNQRIIEHTFSNDYVFLMGDHRSVSRDSRVFGFIPENKIIGKATFILFSYINGKIDRNSLLKRIY